MKRYFMDKDRLMMVVVEGDNIKELAEVGSVIAEELPDARIQLKKSLSKGKEYKCGKCGKKGHQARKCPEKENLTDLSDGDTDQELADKIRSMWAEDGQSSVEVSKDLGISIGKMNRIIMQFKIVRE